VDDQQQDAVTCYCFLRQTNAEYDAQLKADGVPDGYCGLCCVCNKPGHTCAHPHQPYTAAWCKVHWQEVLDSRPITLPLYVFVLLLFFLAIFSLLSIIG